MQNKKTILIGGEAGQGIALTSYIVGKALTKAGYFVFNYRDYPSLIRGGQNFNILTISDQPVFSHENHYDFILAFDQKTVDEQQKNLLENGKILAAQQIKAKNHLPIDVSQIIRQLKTTPLIGNNVLLGALFKALDLPLKILEQIVAEEFSAEKTITIKKAIEIGYNLTKRQCFLFKPKNKIKANYFLTGNEAISAGAIASGLDIYFAYPMTPATSVLTYLAKEQLENKIMVLQLENEIAVANAAVGASFTGAVTMVGTSGGGFDLMTEAMSLSSMAETPLVAYFSQRPGPSTGVPTYTTQGDLKTALYPGHGEFSKLVVAPGDAQEAYFLTRQAFYFSQKYRLLSIILGDKHLAESHYTLEKFAASKIKNNRNISFKFDLPYYSYKITPTGCSPRLVPGQGAIARATSYEHNETGQTVEDSANIIKMNNKRLNKLKTLKKELDKIETIKIYGKGKNLIIGWGSTKGAILDALAKLKNYRFLQIQYLCPFPVKQVLKEIKKSGKVVLIENNATGLLGDLIAEQTGYVIKDKLLKYDGRPFTAGEIVKAIK